MSAQAIKVMRSSAGSYALKLKTLARQLSMLRSNLLFHQEMMIPSNGRLRHLPELYHQLKRSNQPFTLPLRSPQAVPDG